MGMDLQVLASHFRELRGELLPTAALRFDRDAELFAQLMPDSRPLLVHDMPPGLAVGIQEDDGIKYVTTDRYGKGLTFTTGRDLRLLRVPGEVDHWNRAVLAFLLALPLETRIVLYWC